MSDNIIIFGARLVYLPTRLRKMRCSKNIKERATRRSGTFLASWDAINGSWLGQSFFGGTGQKIVAAAKFKGCGSEASTLEKDWRLRAVFCGENCQRDISNWGDWKGSVNDQKSVKLEKDWWLAVRERASWWKTDLKYRLHVVDHTMLLYKGT